jgi:hypothetical protein
MKFLVGAFRAIFIDNELFAPGGACAVLAHWAESAQCVLGKKSLAKAALAKSHKDM